MIAASEADEAHAKARSRKQGPQGTRSRSSQSPIRIYGVHRLRLWRVRTSPSAAALLGAFAALRKLIRSPKPVAGLARTASELLAGETWDFEFRISCFEFNPRISSA
jgi:hypothetical protein